jgi:hypothetical protein
MREQMRARLEELKKELETGQAELQKVEAQRTYLHETMLRISGAMQALEELLAQGGARWTGRDSHQRKTDRCPGRRTRFLAGRDTEDRWTTGPWPYSRADRELWTADARLGRGKTPWLGN